MREHKYRAYFHGRKPGDPVRHIDFTLDDLDDGFINVPGDSGYLGDALAVVDFIGLHDKNGKDVYESDIVRIGEDHWSASFAGKAKIVEYDTQRAFFEPFGDGDWSPVQDADEAYEFEVIGNLYETPDLIT